MPSIVVTRRYNDGTRDNKRRLLSQRKRKRPWPCGLEKKTVLVHVDPVPFFHYEKVEHRVNFVQGCCQGIRTIAIGHRCKAKLISPSDKATGGIRPDAGNGDRSR